MFDKLTAPVEVALTPEQKVARTSFRQARQYMAIAERLDPAFVAAQKRQAPPRRVTICGNGDPNLLAVPVSGVYRDLSTGDEWGAVTVDSRFTADGVESRNTIVVGWVKL